MPRIIAVTVMLATLAAQPVLAQSVPDEAEMDLWCGTAFELMTRDAPADATPEKLAAAQVYADGGAFLVSRALPIYLESGYTNETLDSFRADLAEAVGRAVNGTTRAGEEPAYSFQDCSALIGQ
jgi:hypothetical protein